MTAHISTWYKRLDGALLRSCETRGEAAARLGVPVGVVGNHIVRMRPDLVARWTVLSRADVPRKYRFRSAAEMRDLVAEAAEAAPLDPDRSQRVNVVLLLLAMFYASGTVRWPRGWAGAVSRAMEAAGCLVPSRGSLRWYRVKLQNDPRVFAEVPGADPALISALENLAAGD